MLKDNRNKNLGVDDPIVAVTSKTFSGDEDLVHELTRHFRTVRINDRPGKLCDDTLVEFLRDADAMILGTESFTGKVMEQLPRLRYVSKYGVGIGNIDFEAAKHHQIEIAYRKGTNSDSAAELTLALVLMLIRRIDQSVQAYRKGEWLKLPGKKLAEMTVGIIGYGHIGKVVAQKLAALSVNRLLVNDILNIPAEPPAEFASLDDLLSESDIVSIHVSMEPQNHHMVNKDSLASMKERSYLINTSRGEVVDESALAEALRNGHLAGAGLDVYENEPNPNLQLIEAPNIITTCHMAGSSNRAIKNMGRAAIEELLKLFGMERV